MHRALGVRIKIDREIHVETRLTLWIYNACHISTFNLSFSDVLSISVQLAGVSFDFNRNDSQTNKSSQAHEVETHAWQVI